MVIARPLRQKRRRFTVIAPGDLFNVLTGALPTINVETIDIINWPGLYTEKTASKFIGARKLTLTYDHTSAWEQATLGLWRRGRSFERSFQCRNGQ